ncbi:MAG: copper chaperone PCu(A)C [Gammaproteobacteria bacterium]
MTLTTKLIQTTLLTLLLLSFSSFTWAKDSISVNNAWVADAPPNSAMHAGYFTIKNSGNEEVELLTVSSPKFKKIEIHQTQVINNIARMVEQDGLPIFENETTKFAPGGLHLMMMEPKGAMKIGDKIELTLKFENNVTKKVTAIVKKRVSK